jgi:riboflavin synthase
MFSGIIEHTGKVLKINKNPKKDTQIIIKTKFLKKDIKIGSSVCCNGVCLTVNKIKKFKSSLDLLFDVSNETLKCSNFSDLIVNSWVNLEKSLRLGDEISGHFVFGHVDETTELIKVKKKSGSYQMTFSIPDRLKKLIVNKGSISLNGVSLTVNNPLSKSFSVNIIPHTWSMTNLSKIKSGSLINVEVDMLARYVTKNSK